MTDVFLYGLADPRTGDIRYVGKSKNPEKRLRQHIRDRNRRPHYPVSRWIRSLLSEGVSPSLTVLWKGPESEWKDAERSEIAKRRATGKLLNVADGGDEPFCSPEQRALNGAKVAKIRDARKWRLMRDLGCMLKRGLVSERTKAKMRARPDVFGVFARFL